MGLRGSLRTWEHDEAWPGRGVWGQGRGYPPPLATGVPLVPRQSWERCEIEGRRITACGAGRQRGRHVQLAVVEGPHVRSGRDANWTDRNTVGRTGLTRSALGGAVPLLFTGALRRGFTGCVLSSPHGSRTLAYSPRDQRPEIIRQPPWPRLNSLILAGFLRSTSSSRSSTPVGVLRVT